MGQIISLDDARLLKLGKGLPAHDPRTLQLHDYLPEKRLPPILQSSNWALKIHQWLMLANNRVGNCTIAAAGHMDMLWTAYAQAQEFIPTDQLILADYSKLSGWDPNAPLDAHGENPTDTGLIELDVLKYWRNTGLMGGRKITAFTAIRPSSLNYVRAGIMLFGGIYTGFALPATCQGQIGGLWDVKDVHLNGRSAPGSWGGHAVPIIAYTPAGLVCVTWGALQMMTWAFFKAYCDEAYAILSADFLDAQGKAPSGFNSIALQSDLQAVAA